MARKRKKNRGGTQRPTGAKPAAADKTPDTGWDLLWRAFKNSRILIAVGLVVAVVIGAGNFVGAWKKIHDAFWPAKPVEVAIRVEPTMQPYDLVTGPHGEAINFETIAYKEAELGSKVEELAERIRQEFQPLPDPKMKFEITGRSLRIERPELLSVDMSSGGVAQNRITLKPEDGLIDITKARALKDSSRSRNRIVFDDEPLEGERVPPPEPLRLSVSAVSGMYESEMLEIYGNSDGYSFHPTEAKNDRVIEFQPSSVTILFDEFAASGLTQEKANHLRSLFADGLRKSLSNKTAVKVSPLTRAAFDKRREEVRELPVSPFKDEFEDQYDVDFIVRASVFIEAADSKQSE